ncbi:MAG: hypothetical protein RLZZ73_746, partial [Actinomycetota bacterium]
AGLGKSFGLAGWTLVYVLISQLGYLVTVNVATSAAVRSAQDGLTTGVGFTPFTSAYYIMLLPYSIVTISIVTALLPHLSKLAMENKVEDVRLQLIRAIRMCGVVTVPSAVALLAFGPLITEVLFFGISLEDSRYIGYVLSALSLGLVAFSINLILIRGFNAFEDTKTQVVSIFIINLISVGLSYLFLEILPSDLVTVGLGVAFSVSYILGLFITIYLLRKHTARIDFSAVRSQHLRLLIASLIAMAPFYLLAWRLDWVNTEFETIKSLAHLLVVLGGGGSLFLLLANLFKVSEVNSAKSYLRSRLLKR